MTLVVFMTDSNTRWTTALKLNDHSIFTKHEKICEQILKTELTSSL